MNYYQISGPKSLGLEWVVENFHETIKNYDNTIKDILRTLVEHAAIQISKILDQYGNGQVLLSGGGVKNTFFINTLLFNRIQNLLFLQNLLLIIKKRSYLDF